MKILWAKFENFRLLKDLEIDFSHNSEKNLTVIRAANESGKTTMLTALQWALYGNIALPGGGKIYRICPLDADDKQIQITATVEFEVIRRNKTSSGEWDKISKYRIIRSASRPHDALSTQGASPAKLYEITESGAAPVENPDQVIRDELPPELREVFFTDGDRTLSFIDIGTEQAEKRRRVEHATRSLLGLEIVEKARERVKNAERKLNTRIKKSDAKGQLGSITSNLEGVRKNIIQEERNLKNATETLSNFDRKLKDIDKEIGEHLKKGDQEELKKALENIKAHRESLGKEMKDAERKHSYLFRNNTLADGLLATSLQSVFDELNELYVQKKIPSTTIPILRERLDQGVCICGEKLDSSDQTIKHRVEHIKELIQASEESDNVQKIITGLYYAMRDRKHQNDTHQWREQYDEVSDRRDKLRTDDESAGRSQVEIERKIDALGNIDIATLKETQAVYKRKHAEAIRNQTTAQHNLESLKTQEKGFAEERDKLLKQEDRNALFLAERNVIADVLKIFEETLTQIKDEELLKVSNEMNRLFLEMIVHDPDQESLATIRRAEISPDFDILVYGGPNDSKLNPDGDLNGASRRALTLAFVLALTKVSEVAAPNVIDTPLGMTSGHVRRAMLKVAIRESQQLILFLTHDEIKGCEDIIDEKAGAIFTLTNSGHYPKMLVNHPGVDEAKILKCDCGHRETCEICERREDVAM